ncbi:MAG: hypothetical protein HN658_00280 [Rhodospirillales bacterium]|nr:hypothetical protein [Rhodospirillales bacterium]MBT4006875.1 hypothetical protein [Rhodospirillales bacterium]MBT5075460.1 hypothetical protein [Rhodospirillales bacterium]MBT5113098.1 hypothetical protein [Rhodospirillales bacterium]MBT5672974.1 hypothetical protein [Rhodospirillales bacterium]
MFCYKNTAIKKGLLAIGILFALVACTPAGKLYSGGHSQHNLLLRPQDQGSVLVAPIIGVPASKALTEAIALALIEAEIPAHTSLISNSAHKTGYTLIGIAQTTRSGQIHWRLMDARGLMVGEYQQKIRKIDQNNPPKKFIAKIATGVAKAMAPFFPGHSKPLSPPVITILGIEGAPGDGAISLRRSMGFALSKLGFKITSDLATDGAAMVLVGDVQMEKISPEFERARIAWSVLAPDGRVLGTIRQASQVRAGSLDQNWGPVAALATKAGAEGVTQLIKRSLKITPTQINQNQKKITP